LSIIDLIYIPLYVIQVQKKERVLLE
jgi:hypothetical protein